MSTKSEEQFILIIRIATFALFLGRGWQYIFFDAPFRTLLWSQGLMEGFITSTTSLTWAQWVQGGGVGDEFINTLTRCYGVYFLVCALVCLFIQSHHRKLGWLFIVATLLIIQLSFLKSMGVGFAIGMFIEHAIQMGMPLVFYLTLFKSQRLKSFMPFFKILISLTFIGHGLYAIGFYPVPGKFIDMIINTFGFSEDNALLMLRAAGILDFSAAIFIFVPALEMFALGFNIFWGITTALARSVAHIDFDLLQLTSHQWIFETVYRLPHGLLPLAILFFIRSSKKTTQ